MILECDGYIAQMEKLRATIQAGKSSGLLTFMALPSSPEASAWPVAAGPPASVDVAAGPPASEVYSAFGAAPVSASLSTDRLAYMSASESPVLPVVPQSPVLPLFVP